MEPRVYKAIQVPLAHRVMWVLQVSLAAQDPQVPQDHKAMWVPQVYKVLKAAQDLQDSQVAQDPLAFRVPLDCRVPQV